ncbi:AAA family ATPase [Pleionea sediminis]|uniref:nucleotide-binding protein n=1 Tax=Pleionea sediminis TaxID=2569479 RepID=UPI00118552B1|nr:ParA family protein [Pleionea sediminis]
MKRVSLWSPKGGVGKTTLALNLAAAAYASGKKAIVCDLDPQQSAVDVFNDKQLSFSVFKGMPPVTPYGDIIFYDLPPRVDIQIEGDLVVVPMRACVLDIRAVNKSIRHVRHKQILKCVNAVDVRRHDERMLAMRMYSEGAFLIKDRSIYSRAISMGKTVFDTDLYGANEARKEMLRLFESLYSGLHAEASRVAKS